MAMVGMPIPVCRSGSLDEDVWEWRAGVGVVLAWLGELRETRARQVRVCLPCSPCGDVWSRPTGSDVESGLHEE